METLIVTYKCISAEEQTQLVELLQPTFEAIDIIANSGNRNPYLIFFIWEMRKDFLMQRIRRGVRR